MDVVIYARVSTDDKEQDPERQVLKCKQYCELKEHNILQIVKENHKGDSPPESRGGFKTINMAKTEAIMVFSIDRLTRQHPVKVMTLLNYYQTAGIKIISVTEPIFNMESEFAELLQYFLAWWNNYFLKKLSRDVKSGLERAKAKGKILGRPKVKINEYEVLRLKNQGKSIRHIAKEINSNIGTVQRCIKKVTGKNNDSFINKPHVP